MVINTIVKLDRNQLDCYFQKLQLAGNHSKVVYLNGANLNTTGKFLNAILTKLAPSDYQLPLVDFNNQPFRTDNYSWDQTADYLRGLFDHSWPIYLTSIVIVISQSDLFLVDFRERDLVDKLLIKMIEEHNVERQSVDLVMLSDSVGEVEVEDLVADSIAKPTQLAETARIKIIDYRT